MAEDQVPVDYSSLSVKELQNILKERNVDFSGCIEKSDLINAVLNSNNIPTAPKPSGRITTTQKEIGALNCIVIERAGVTPKLVVVLCHGLGANGENLAPIGSDFLNRNPSADVQFVFPDAPTIMEQTGGRAWWPLNLQELMVRAMNGQIAQIINESPPGLETARVCLESVILELQNQTKLPWEKFLIGGFSQGAIIGTDLLLQLPYDFGGLAIFSGSLLSASAWNELARVRANRNTKILQSHGRQDFMLPFILASSLRNFLTQYFQVDFVEFNGGHTIPNEALEKFNRLVLSLSNS